MIIVGVGVLVAVVLRFKLVKCRTQLNRCAEHMMNDLVTINLAFNENKIKLSSDVCMFCRLVSVN